MSAFISGPPRTLEEADERQMRLSAAHQQARLKVIAAEVEHLRQRHDRVLAHFVRQEHRSDMLLGLGRCFGVREKRNR